MIRITVHSALLEPRGENRYYIEGTNEEGEHVSLHLVVAPDQRVPEPGDLLELNTKRKNNMKNHELEAAPLMKGIAGILEDMARIDEVHSRLLVDIGKTLLDWGTQLGLPLEKLADSYAMAAAVLNARPGSDEPGDPT